MWACLTGATHCHPLQIPRADSASMPFEVLVLKHALATTIMAQVHRQAHAVVNYVEHKRHRLKATVGMVREPRPMPQHSQTSTDRPFASSTYVKGTRNSSSMRKGSKLRKALFPMERLTRAPAPSPCSRDNTYKLRHLVNGQSSVTLVCRADFEVGGSRVKRHAR